MSCQDNFSQKDQLPLCYFDTDKPCYYNAAVIEPLSSNTNDIIATYKVKTKGWLDDKMVFENGETGEKIHGKIFLTGAKLFNQDKKPLLELKYNEFTMKSFVTTTWNIKSISKESQLYNSVTMFKQDFEEEPVYLITMVTKDEKTLQFEWRSSGFLESRWKLSPKNDPKLTILKYSAHMLKSDQLLQFCYIFREDFNIFLICLMFLLHHRDTDPQSLKDVEFIADYIN